MREFTKNGNDGGGSFRSCLTIMVIFLLFVSAGVFPCPAVAAEGTLPGVYPPVYPLQRPSYGSNSFPLRRNALGTVRPRLGINHGGLLTNQGTITWLAGSNANLAAVKDTTGWNRLVDWDIGFQRHDVIAAFSTTKNTNCTIAVDVNGNAWAAGDTTIPDDTNPAVSSIINEINRSGSKFHNGHIVQVACGSGHFVALRDDGTVVAGGRNNGTQLSGIDGQTGVVKIAAQEGVTALVKADGSCIITGQNSCSGCGAYYQNQAIAKAWATPNAANPIIDVALGRHLSIALRADGTVEVCTVWSFSPNVSSWKNVVQVYASDAGVGAMQANGSVLRVSSGADNRFVALTAPEDVTVAADRAFYVSGGQYSTIALLNNGKYATSADSNGNNGLDHLFPGNWNSQFGNGFDYGPVIDASAESGEYPHSLSVVLTAGDTQYQNNIYYTLSTDGNTPPEPTRQSPHYTEPIVIGENSRLRAKIITADGINGMELQRSYTIAYSAVVITPAFEKYHGRQLVTLALLSSDAEHTAIRYTINGSTPGAGNGMEYTAPFAIENRTVTVKAVSVDRQTGKVGTVVEKTYQHVAQSALLESLKVVYADGSELTGSVASAAGREIRAEADVFSIAQSPCTLVLAAYRPNRSLYAIKLKRVNIAQGTSGKVSTEGLQLPNDVTGYTIKAFLMEGFSTLTPIGNYIERK